MAVAKGTLQIRARPSLPPGSRVALLFALGRLGGARLGRTSFVWLLASSELEASEWLEAISQTLGPGPTATKLKSDQQTEAAKEAERQRNLLDWIQAIKTSLVPLEDGVKDPDQKELEDAEKEHQMFHREWLISIITTLGPLADRINSSFVSDYDQQDSADEVERRRQMRELIQALNTTMGSLTARAEKLLPKEDQRQLSNLEEAEALRRRQICAETPLSIIGDVAVGTQLSEYNWATGTSWSCAHNTDHTNNWAMDQISLDTGTWTDGVADADYSFGCDLAMF